MQVRFDSFYFSRPLSCTEVIQEKLHDRANATFLLASSDFRLDSTQEKFSNFFRFFLGNSNK